MTCDICASGDGGWMAFRSVIAERMDADMCQAHALQGTGLSYVEALLVSKWRKMSDTDRGKLLHFWRHMHD